MPINYDDYHPDWLIEIRPAILERDGHRCRFCGVPNGLLIMRHETEPERYIYFDAELNYRDNTGRRVFIDEAATYNLHPIKVVLTIAHLDHNVANNDAANLAALCQRCHLNYDRPLNVKRAVHTRSVNAGRKAEQEARDAGQLGLFE